MSTTTLRDESADILFAGPGEMRARCRMMAWERTPLGPVRDWPQSLRTMATTVLATGFPVIVLWGSESVQLYNDAYIPFLGVKHPHALGVSSPMCWPEVWNTVEPILERVRTGETVTLEDQHYPLARRGPNRPHDDVYITLSYVPVLDESVSVRGVLVTGIETTAQVEARRLEAERARLASALRDAHAQLLDEVFRQAPSFLAVYEGPDHVIAMANDAYYQLVGHGREIIGRPLLEALPEVAGQGFDVLLDTVLHTGERFVAKEIPVRLARVPGEKPEDRVVALTYLPFLNADAERVGVIAHGIDVTDHVLARAELDRVHGDRARLLLEAEAARRTAEDANKAKGDFLAVISHELRTPLNAIAGYTELLALGLNGPVTSEQQVALDRIQRSQRHLLGLINGVLSYASVDAGAVSYVIEALPMDDVVATCESLVAPQIGAKGLHLSYASCDAGVIARGDRGKVQQILLNLIGNAVKFTASGGRVTLNCSAVDNNRVLVSVTDTGVGIAADQLERVFQPFVQLDSTLTRTSHGTGLGLAISRDLARGMGGDVTVESTPGLGSIFTLTLPAL